ncbi:hypothetical protein PspLS_04887 [Pyricularia sp. CBS 133598]|nr:hypothetical protein PspLS_04887 [Pyricularia sp. CBS 133598]
MWQVSTAPLDTPSFAFALGQESNGGQFRVTHSHPLPSHQRGTQTRFLAHISSSGRGLFDSVLRTQVWYLALVGGFRKEIDTTKNTSQPKGTKGTCQHGRTAFFGPDGKSSCSTRSLAFWVFCACVSTSRRHLALQSQPNIPWQYDIWDLDKRCIRLHGNPPTPLPCSVHHSPADDFAVAATRVGMEKKVAHPSLFYLVRRSLPCNTPPYVVSFVPVRSALMRLSNRGLIREYLDCTCMYFVLWVLSAGTCVKKTDGRGDFDVGYLSPHSYALSGLYLCGTVL